MKSYFVFLNPSLVLSRLLFFRFWLRYDKFLICLHVPECLRRVSGLKKDRPTQGSEINSNFPQTSHIFSIKFELCRLEVFSNPTRGDRLGDHRQPSMESEGDANLSRERNKTTGDQLASFPGPAQLSITCTSSAHTHNGVSPKLHHRDKFKQ